MMLKKGKTVYCRLAQPDDASFIHKLRIDSRYNQHLSKVTGDEKDQYNWLVNYKHREQLEQEFYFIILRMDNDEPIGTVRLYDFINNRESFCWGSWILNEKKTKSAAIESAMLVYEYAFKTLAFSSCHFDVRKENEKVVDFHKKFGATVISEDDLNYYFKLQPENYFLFHQQYRKYLCE